MRHLLPCPARHLVRPHPKEFEGKPRWRGCRASCRTTSATAQSRSSSAMASSPMPPPGITSSSTPRPFLGARSAGAGGTRRLGHVGTTLNGRQQSYATWLGAGSPASPPVRRGWRYSSRPSRSAPSRTGPSASPDRVMAIDMAERGADFIEVFRHFVAGPASTTPTRSQRVFRGGMVEGAPALPGSLPM